MVLLETPDVHAQVKVQRNKTHNNDTLPLGGSHVHTESAASFSVRLLLTHRRTLKRKFLDLENEIHHSLKVFRVEQSAIRRADSEARVRELIGADAPLEALTRWCARRGQEYTRLPARANRGPESSAGDSRRCGAWVRRGRSRSRRRR
jgi:transposase